MTVMLRRASPPSSGLGVPYRPRTVAQLVARAASYYRYGEAVRMFEYGSCPSGGCGMAATYIDQLGMRAPGLLGLLD